MLQRCLLRCQPRVNVRCFSDGATVKNAVGQCYQDIVFRGRKVFDIFFCCFMDDPLIVLQGLLLSIRELKVLFPLCQTPEHVKYAVYGVEYFQSKGMDFSQEINSLFVKTCVRCDDPMAAAKVFLVPRNRIGAWSTVTSIHRLVESLKPLGESSTISSLLVLLSNKGVHVNKDVVSAALQTCVEKQDLESYETVLEQVAKKKLTMEEVNELIALYPAFEAPAPAEADPSETEEKSEA